MKKFYLAFLLFSVSLLVNNTFAQISLTATNGSYSEPFNGMESSGTSLPTGWSAIRIGGTGTLNQALAPTVTNGGASSGGVYNVGTTGAADRALGTLASGSTIPAFGASFTNNTTAVIGNLSFSAFSEQWRTGGNSSINETVIFEYSTDATSLSTGSWQTLPSLNLVELLTSTTTSAAVDGNTNKVAISGTISTINLAVGSTIWIRWKDADNTGTDGLYALDDFQLSWTNVAVANTVSVSSANNAAEPATNGSFTVTLNNPAPAGGVTINYTLTGSATMGADYSNPQNGTVTIPQGATTGTIDITVIDDNISEPTETITVTLNNINAGYSIATGNASITLVDNEATTLFSADFSTCASTLSNGFTQQSITGDQVWSCTTFGRLGNAVQMNGFASTAQVNEDWLISPAINLTGTNFPLLSFYSRSAFNGAPLQLYITTNYTGDVTTTTWTELGGMFPAAGSDVWTLSQNINLSSFKQANVHIAFKYVSTSSAASRWTLDDLTILNSTVAPPPSLSVKNTILDFRQIGAGELFIGKSFTFTAHNATAALTITAPDNFLLSKNNLTYSKTLTYSVSELAAGQKTVYVGFSPTATNTIYSGLLSFVSTGINTQQILLKGNTYPLASTLNVVNWNLEWFGGAQGPANNDLQQENVKKAMDYINADVYALTEIVDTARLGNLVRSLEGGYDYVVSDYASLAPSASDPAYTTGQKLALVYKTSIVSGVTARGLMKSSSTANSSWASGRVPFLVNTKVTKNNVSKNISFIVVHGKAGDTQNDFLSRRAGVTELKDTLDRYFNNKSVIILGDFNDDLDQSIYTSGGVHLSSYDPLIKDSVDGDHYKSVTLLLSQYGMNSTVDYSDVIDHVVISNEIAPSYLPISASLFNDLEMLAGIQDYGNTTTDHYAVLSRYFITQIAESPLPVKLTEFAASKQANTVKLTWKTAQELNTKEHIVERSADGIIFSAVGKVAAAGNSNQAKEYQLVDGNPLQGVNYYRLKSIDFDEKSETSKIVKVVFGDYATVNIWPNPAKSSFTVNTSASRSQLEIIDLNGKIVKSLLLTNPIEKVVIPELSKGVYLIRVISNNTVLTQKLIVE